MHYPIPYIAVHYTILSYTLCFIAFVETRQNTTANLKVLCFIAIQYYAIQCSVSTLYYIILYYTIEYYTISYYAIVYYTQSNTLSQNHTLHNCTTLYYPILYISMQHNAVSNYTLQYNTVQYIIIQ
jgi:hypothetical protein